MGASPYFNRRIYLMGGMTSSGITSGLFFRRWPLLGEAAACPSKTCSRSRLEWRAFTISEVANGAFVNQIPFIKRLMARAGRTVLQVRLAQASRSRSIELFFLRQDGGTSVLPGLAQGFHHLAASRHNTEPRAFDVLSPRRLWYVSGVNNSLDATRSIFCPRRRPLDHGRHRQQCLGLW